MDEQEMKEAADKIVSTASEFIDVVVRSRILASEFDQAINAGPEAGVPLEMIESRMLELIKDEDGNDNRDRERALEILLKYSVRNALAEVIGIIFS